MAKRRATTDINRDNWDKEDEPEEVGLFQKADEEVLQRRVIKTAKRQRNKLQGSPGSTPSPFSGFAGFGNTSSTTSSPFSFLNQSKNSSITGNQEEEKNQWKKETESQTKSPASSVFKNTVQSKDNSSTSFFSNLSDSKSNDGTVKSNDKDKSDGDSDKKSENLEKLKDLNLSFNKWITEHLEKNPYCILTPILKDYEKHLAQLDLESKPVEKKEMMFQLPKPNLSSESSKSFFFGKEKPVESKDEKEKIGELKSDSKPALQFCGPKKTFQFSGLFQQTPSSTINLNVGSSTVGSDATQSEGNDDEDKEESEQQKFEFTPVVEEDSIFDKRCKVFLKKDDDYVSKGVGTLFLKPVKDSKNTQLIVRADTSSGNILLNVLLTSSIPVRKTGKNNIMIMCIPTPDCKPPPVAVLIKVKTAEDCDEVIKKLEECKG